MEPRAGSCALLLLGGTSAWLEHCNAQERSCRRGSPLRWLTPSPGNQATRQSTRVTVHDPPSPSITTKWSFNGRPGQSFLVLSKANCFPVRASRYAT